MQLYWTAQSRKDLQRLYDFLAPENPKAAGKTVQTIYHSTDTLLQFPTAGQVVEAYHPREVRRWLAGAYELHYEITKKSIVVLSVWHQRENRLH